MCGNKQRHCVCLRVLIPEGMNLEIAESTAKNIAAPTLALCNIIMTFKFFSDMNRRN